MQPSHRKIRLLIVALVSAAVCVMGTAVHQAQSMVVAACRPVDTHIEPETLSYLQRLMSSSVAIYKNVRDSLGFAQVSANRVKLVTKTATCQSGVNALNTILSTPNAPRSIWLFDLVHGYAVYDPTVQPGGTQPIPVYIFSTQFVYNSALIVH
jgi:hypothetical protein